MSDKKEIATLSIKISVDSTDLDKLEAQLKRIEGLMVGTGLKQPASGGFVASPFFVENGQTFINAPLITSATLEPAIKYTVSGLHSDKYIEDLKQAVKQAIRPVIRQHIKVQRVGEKQSEFAFCGGVRVEPEEPAEFEKFKQQVESEFSQLQTSITAIQKTIADSDGAFAASLEHLRADIQSVKSGWL
ncbi:hypothetical protein LHV18_22325 [Providencia rettgeri]|uniref:hypothetical protein n=1 Tax=Providencia TaxID=586 RepID=UPI001CFE4AE8|nr:hypothetical protein [Providencia rettgeri]EIU7559258.1 hypothetical protein [Providencia rettgeri]MCB4843349.1 hypothetical protein [Providencia rettgeri]MCG5277756.1 hypothetical protein [Providencia rettgeri]MCG9508700.1 hypothetical protein [Providencia rettgeri]